MNNPLYLAHTNQDLADQIKIYEIALDNLGQGCLHRKDILINRIRSLNKELVYRKNAQFKELIMKTKIFNQGFEDVVITELPKSVGVVYESDVRQIVGRASEFEIVEGSVYAKIKMFDEVMDIVASEIAPKIYAVPSIRVRYDNYKITHVALVAYPKDEDIPTVTLNRF